MNRPCPTDDRRALAAIITEALHLADRLQLPMVGISLNGALEQLTGEGIAPDPGGPFPH